MAAEGDCARATDMSHQLDNLPYNEKAESKEHLLSWIRGKAKEVECFQETDTLLMWRIKEMEDHLFTLPLNVRKMLVKCTTQVQSNRHYDTFIRTQTNGMLRDFIVLLKWSKRWYRITEDEYKEIVNHMLTDVFLAFPQCWMERFHIAQDMSLDMLMSSDMTLDGYGIGFGIPGYERKRLTTKKPRFVVDNNAIRWPLLFTSASDAEQWVNAAEEILLATQEGNGSTRQYIIDLLNNKRNAQEEEAKKFLNLGLLMKDFCTEEKVRDWTDVERKRKGKEEEEVGQGKRVKESMDRRDRTMERQETLQSVDTEYVSDDEEHSRYYNFTDKEIGNWGDKFLPDENDMENTNDEIEKYKRSLCLRERKEILRQDLDNVIKGKEVKDLKENIGKLVLILSHLETKIDKNNCMINNDISDFAHQPWTKENLRRSQKLEGAYRIACKRERGRDKLSKKLDDLRKRHEKIRMRNIILDHILAEKTYSSMVDGWVFI